MVKPCMFISYLTRENVFLSFTKSGFTCFKINKKDFKLQLYYINKCPCLPKQCGILANAKRWLAPMSNYTAFGIKTQKYDLNKT